MRVRSSRRHPSPRSKAAGARSKNRRVTKPGTVEGTLASLYATDILFAETAGSAGPGPLDLERDHVDEH